MKKRRFGRLAALVMVLACLAMLLCGASSIRDVILFPTMKPLDN